MPSTKGGEDTSDSLPQVVPPTAAAIRKRYAELRTEYEGAQNRIECIQAHQRELVGMLSDCLAAARLFEVDLAPFPLERNGVGGLSIKGLVLRSAEDAYPQPVRALDVRRRLEEQGYSIHEKTVGMTLYRWSLVGRVRRAGRDWFFVPQADSDATNIDNQRPEPERERVMELA